MKQTKQKDIQGVSMQDTTLWFKKMNKKNSYMRIMYEKIKEFFHFCKYQVVKTAHDELIYADFDIKIHNTLSKYECKECGHSFVKINSWAEYID